MSVFGLKLSIPKRSLNDGKVREAVFGEDSSEWQLRAQSCPNTGWTRGSIYLVGLSWVQPFGKRVSGPCSARVKTYMSFFSPRETGLAAPELAVASVLGFACFGFFTSRFPRLLLPFPSRPHRCCWLVRRSLLRRGHCRSVPLISRGPRLARFVEKLFQIQLLLGGRIAHNLSFRGSECENRS